MKSEIKSFRDLVVWQKASALATLLYKVTENFPKTEIYGITSQMRRAAVSVSSNIAEGFKRNSKKEKVQFYSIAQGSLTELQNQLLIAKDVGFLDKNTFSIIAEQSIKVSKITNGLVKKSRSYS